MERREGVRAERFYQEPNPPNTALNKNEIDKAWRSHHRDRNIRQTGDLQSCSLKYQKTLSVPTG